MTKPEFQKVDDGLKIGEEYISALRKKVNDPNVILHKAATKNLMKIKQARALVKKELG